MLIADIIAINVFAHAQRATPPVSRDLKELINDALVKQKEARKRAQAGFPVNAYEKCGSGND
jgi:hypothetical protein